MRKKSIITRHTVREARKQLNILVVEDNIVNQKLVAKMLERRGHYTAIANNGVEAIKAFENNEFHLILMDVQMPKMDGHEATKIIRFKEKEMKKHIPIIALTAHAMKGDRERCLEAGMDDYITKPINPEKLFEAIESQIDRTA